jgi:hypothetical protein
MTTCLLRWGKLDELNTEDDSFLPLSDRSPLRNRIFATESS